MLYSMILPFCHYKQISYHNCLELFCLFSGLMRVFVLFKNSLVEPDGPSQSSMVLEVPSLDLLVTR